MATATSATNSGLSLSGLASGMDWTSIVNELLSIERAPETLMQGQITKLQQKNSAYQGIGSQLSTLAKDITTLSDPSFFDSRTNSVSNPDVASATVSNATPLGSYTLKILQLASDAVQQGATVAVNQLSSSNDVSSLTLSSADLATPITAGTFTVNGQSITIATSDTLQSVFDQISSATNGAVTASYDSTTDEISLNSSSPIILGSSADTSNFLQATKLYNNGTGTVTSTSSLGGISLSRTMGSSNLTTPISDGGSGQGQFLINGVAINYDSSSDAIKDVLNRINDSAAGVTATYDAINNRFILTDKTTGDVGISMQDVTGNFLAATGISSGTLQRGTNLQYTVNGGGTLISQSNTIDGSSSGVTGLSVMVQNVGSTTITIGSDTSKISSAISQFVSDYNAAQNYISAQTKTTTSSTGAVTPGPLTGDLDAEGIEDALRRLANASPFSGSIRSLNDLGIVSNGTDNTLALSNTSTLTTALSTNLQAIKQLFTDSTKGIATTLNTYLNSVNGSNGPLANSEASMNKQVTDLQNSISALETRITADGNRLTNEFVNMETTINNINQQKTYLNQFMSGSGSSSNSAPTAAGSSFGGSSSS